MSLVSGSDFHCIKELGIILLSRGLSLYMSQPSIYTAEPKEKQRIMPSDNESGPIMTSPLCEFM